MNDIATILDQASLLEGQLPPAIEPALLPQGRQIAGWIDHTLLKPDATTAQVEKICEDALNFQFAAVCVNPTFVPLAARLLTSSAVKVCTVVGFPLGASLATSKVLETYACLEAGAVEIDMVIHIGALKGEAYGLVLNDIAGVVQASHHQGAITKVILENALLTRREKIIACLLCKAAGADFVKTSTGFAASGATHADVELMRRVVGPQIGVKAAGGVRNYADALAMIRAGATRIGSSSGVSIVQAAEAGSQEAK
jgi:deoxyribose-phosphate aldolase